MKRPHLARRHPRGFALVITLSLMVLLTLLAVGLLTLSSISLRSSSQGEAMQMARANARLAMLLAIGDLQKNLGQDNRITATADQFLGSASGSTATSQPARHFLGAYKSWDIAAKTRPAPEFVSWFVSGDRSGLSLKDWASSAVSTGDSIAMVSEKAAGKPGGVVRVPFLSQKVQGKSNQFAWWVSDLGTKGLIGKAKELPKNDLAAVREDSQTMPSSPLQVVKVAEQLPFQGVVTNDPALGKVFSLGTAGLLASEPTLARGTIHDLTAFNRGLLTNVRRGGFRNDLSMYLEKPNNAVPTDALYSVGGKSGINMSELWLHYNMWKELRKGGRFTYSTGGAMPVTASYLQMEGSLSATLEDKEYYYKQPTFIQYQTLLSFHARVGQNATGQTGKFLQLVVDPVVTYWNPLDVPVVVTPAYNSIKFWQLPYDVKVQVGGVTAVTSLQKLLGGSEWHYLTLIAGKAKPMVLKPGEVLVVSQGPNTPIYQQPLKGIANNYFDAIAGWNFGGGIAFDMVDANNQKLFFATDSSFKYEVTPNSVISSGSRRWSINHHECYFKEDREGRGESIGIGGVYIDYIYGQPHNQDNPKPESSRMVATSNPKFFGKIPPSSTRTLSLGQVTGRKEPFMLYSYRVKTERGSERPSRFLSRFNPKSMLVDFYDLTDRELDVLPFEVQINPITSFKAGGLLEVSTNGNGYFGGGTNAQDGTSFVTTHSVPREPIYSLGAMQHAFANGFTSLSPQSGYAVINGRQPFLPQISHPIGNSFAPSVLAPNKTDGSIGGGRLLADHSYLANQALWDDWFFSSIAPQTAPAFTTKRSQQKVAEDFLNGDKELPLHRYHPALGGKTTKDIVGKIFTGSRLSAQAHQMVAPLLEVEGLFNVNSTSVEAWKIVLSSLKEREIVTRDLAGNESTSSSYETPVATLNAPVDLTLAKLQTADLKEPAQWTGRRTLSDDEIDLLAKAIVREVRKRGPFLSLGDFINRRVSTDQELALSGTIQSALDSPDVTINKPFRDGTRQVTDTKAYAFPKAEAGPAATGIPGIVKQADILTPIAPYLSARSDSFLIRTCGRVADSTGKVIATAYCEAVVQRTAEFLDPTDPPETLMNRISPLNNAFGRRFKVISFRWIDPQEI